MRIIIMITNEGLFDVYYDEILILTVPFNERFIKLIEYFKDNNIKEFDENKLKFKLITE